MLRKNRLPLRLWRLIACITLIVSMLSPLQPVRATPLLPPATGGDRAASYSAPQPTGSPSLVASITGAGQVGPDGVVPLLVTLNAGAGEALATLEASASGADGQWQTLATLSTPGPVTLSTGFNLTLPAFGGSAVAGERTVYLRASDASGNRSTAALVVAYDPALPSFSDVPGNLPAAEAEAIRQMAARGVIKGYSDGSFGPGDPTQRAQMAALIARAMGYGTEDWGSSFTDRGGLIDSLWRNVGTLQHYQVALGYDGAACAERNTGSPCFGPTEPVTKAQTISFITRAMVKRGIWQQRLADPNPFPNIPASSGHVADLATYVHYVGAPPGTTAGQDWPDWSAVAATRGWFAQAEWRVVQWLESSLNWATLPQPPFAHRAHGTATGAHTSDAAPGIGDTVTVGAWLHDGGTPVPSATLTVTAGAATCTGTSGGDGWAKCQLPITQAMAGDTVTVDTTFAHQGATHSARVVLNVSGDTAPSPSPSASASPLASPSAPASPSALPSPSPVGSLPPDPATVAPPLAPGLATDFGSATEFLYTGNNPIQSGVQPGTIRHEHAAVLSGKVITRDGQPLPGVRISVKDHPEYGSTLSRIDGQYDLVVNGGALVLDFQREGFLPAQRQVQAPWRDYAAVPDVALVPLSGQATVIDLTSNAPIQVARGDAQQDADGSRQATLFFPQGTTASLTLPGGGTQPLTSLTVRATEYTVGDNGPAAMPGDLPPTSAYTYAVELSADEAIAAGATSVVFSQPVPLYLENFLGFPVGTAVPAGFYDRQLAAWVPSDNGRVVKVLSITAGLADLDLDGDNVADGAAALAALGVTDAERAQLATLYQPGQTLWRTPIPHFTPWDCNWPYGPPQDFQAPERPDPNGGPGPGPDTTDGPGSDDGEGESDDPNDTDEITERDDCETGSVILCRDQILNELLPVAGTDLQLVYSSGRAPARNTTYSLDIPVTGAQVPASMTSATVRIYTGGQVITQRIGAAPHQNLRFEWDGRDQYGRRIYTAQPVAVQIKYEFPLVYHPVRADWFRAFGSYATASSVPGQFVHADRAGMTVSFNQTWWGTLQRPRPEAVAEIATLGGWTFDQHHRYDPVSGTIHFGDGTRRSIDALDTVEPVLQHDPDAGITLAEPWGMVVADDGTVYVSDTQTHRIWRVLPDGTATVIVGNRGIGFSGDGGPAITAQLNTPMGLALSTDGSLYIADSGNHRIRRIAPSGTITTVAGRGAATFDGDSGLADVAGLKAPQAVAVASDGTLYITDSGNHRIRRVDVGGIIITIAGGGSKIPAEDDGGLDVMLHEPRSLALDRSGRLYFITVEGVEGTKGRVLRLDQDGTIHPVAGGGGDANNNGIPAHDASFNYPRAVAVGPDGSVYVSDRAQVRRVTPRGIIVAAIGPGIGKGLIGQIAGAADIGELIPSLAYGQDGRLYFVNDNAEAHVAKVGAPLPGFQADEFGLPSADGNLIYVFEVNGLHRRTIDALTGTIVWSFEYDTQGRVVALDDGDGNVTRVEYNGKHPSAIVAPFGQRTTLTVDANGWLETVTDPANQITRLITTADGLLTSLTEPNNGVHTYTYTGHGYLSRDEDPDGRIKTLVRTDRQDGRGYIVTVTSKEGRVTVYGEALLSDGAIRRTKRYADGTTTETLVIDDGTVEITQPDGSTTTQFIVPDPRWGMLAPLKLTLTALPNGRTFSREIERTVTLANPRDPLSLVSQVDKVTVNGKVTTTTYIAATRTITTVTPENRVATIVLDERGRMVREQRAASLLATTFTYDERGRLETLSQGTGAEQRLSTLVYGPDGLLASVTDPLNRFTQFGRDALGRIETITRPDGRVIGFGYNVQGNLEELTPPGRPVHTQGYTPAGRVRSYEAPPPDAGGAVARTEWENDRDGLISSVTRADETVVGSVRDGAARVKSIALPRGQVVASYDPDTGLLTSLTAPGGVSLTYGYDGTVRTGESWTGPVSGSVLATVDDNLWLASRAVNGQVVTYTRNDDGRATQAGALALTLDPATGLPMSATLGGVVSQWTHDGFAELRNIHVTANNGLIYRAAFTRDKLGRVGQKVETVGGVTSTYIYGYDLAGRLREVTLNGAVVEAYTYDDNGNRLSATTVSGGVTATHDDRDRLIQQGAFTYAYTDDGELRTKTTGDETTTYTYDPRGSLLAVSLPDGRAIEYVIDGQDRRVGKRVDGTLVQGFLYAGDRIAAELDGAGNIVSTFVYDDGLVPAYMVKGGTTYRLVTDQLGSVRLVVNASTGQILQRLDYDSFGNVALDTNPGFQPFGFAGGLYDRDTRLVRFGARDYDPQAGRWTAKDPILFAGGQPNLYTYVGNDPINRIDPSGLVDFTPSPWSGVTGAVTAAGVANSALGGLEVSLILGAGTAAEIVAATGGVLAAFAAGYTIGTVIDQSIIAIFDKSLGEAVYDWLYPEEKQPAYDPQKEPGWPNQTCS